MPGRHIDRDAHDYLKMDAQVRRVTLDIGAYPPFEEKVIAEAMNSHRSGPKERGSFKVKEDKKKVVMTLTPCGSGGRMGQSRRFLLLHTLLRFGDIGHRTFRLSPPGHPFP